jgi:hypothetical protein
MVERNIYAAILSILLVAIVLIMLGVVFYSGQSGVLGLQANSGPFGNPGLSIANFENQDAGLVFHQPSEAMFQGDNFVNTGIPLNLGDEFTISAWFKADRTAADTDQGSMRIVDKSLQGLNWAPYSLRLDEMNRVVFMFRYENTNRDPQAVRSRMPVQTGEWYLVTVALNDGLLSLYINGMLHQEIQVIGSPYPSNDMVFIGAANGVPGFGPRHFFHGSIADVRIYDRALSPQEIRGMAR